MFNFQRSQPKEKKIRLSVSTVVKCLKLLRLRGDFDLVLNESTINSLIQELNRFDPNESFDVASQGKALAKQIKETMDDQLYGTNRPKPKPYKPEIKSKFSGELDDHYGGSY